LILSGSTDSLSDAEDLPNHLLDGAPGNWQAGGLLH
jgi:hypothetical protein